MNKNLNIYTVCNEKYIDFAPIFILSNLYFNRNSFVEIGSFKNSFNLVKESLDVLNTIYPNEFICNEIDTTLLPKNIQANALRFVLEPSTKMDYVYISDIDIIVLESNILDTHLKIMKENKLPYSNIIRPNSQRLSGLHFTPWENYYPIKKYNHLNGYLNHDEVFLFHLIKERFPNLSNTSQLRPVHGIHVSPNREPSSDGPDWGMHDNRKDGWMKLRNSREFNKLYPTLSIRLKKIISVIDKHYNR